MSMDQFIQFLQNTYSPPIAKIDGKETNEAFLFLIFFEIIIRKKHKLFMEMDDEIFISLLKKWDSANYMI